MSSFDDALSALTPEQRAVFELLLRRERTAAPGTGAIPRRGDPSAHPLSFAQQRLWFLDQLAPGDAAYNIHGAIRLRGALDTAALARALAAIAARHEPLRARFAAVEGRPVQIIDPAGPVPLPVIDLGALPAARREPEVLRLAVEAARRPFDLARGPLLRTSLLRAGPADQILLLAIHHIAADGWSIGVLLHELTAFYAAFAAGRPAALPPLPIAYSDFAAWQRERLQGDRLAREVEHWRTALAGLPELCLPAEQPLPDQGSRGATVPVTLPPALVERLRALGRGAGASLFMALLAAFQVLLSRWTGQRDFAVGSPVANRTRPELEGLIGFFVNTLVLRADLRGDPSFLDLLGRVERTAVDAFAHQELPFERLVEELQPERRLGRTPFFTAVLVLQNLPAATARLSGLEMELLPVRNGTARFDLTLTLTEERGGLAGDLEYRLAALSVATARSMAGHLRVLLEAIAADPGRPVSMLPLLTTAERRQILGMWSRSADEVPREACLHELFAAQAARTPDAVALIDGDRETTYRELGRRSARLARRLCAAGAGPDVPVAVFLERSAEMVVALLGILRAGAAYVPLDLGYPRERLAWMLEDSGARLAVARRAAGGSLASQGVQVVWISDLPAEETVEPPVVPVSPDNLAYIVYTSGSAGKPKGVAATHRGVARVVIDPGYVELGPEETILQLAPVPFDASTFEIWGALLNGGRLAVFPAGPVSLHELAWSLSRYQVTTLFLTTGLFHQMIDEEPEGLGGTRQLITGGDVISVARVRRALETLPGCRLIHAYGPTETTTYATCHTVSAEDAARPALTLGRPIARTTAWILDERLEPVPPGVAGELYLGGDGLARGYWRRPGQTAERFVPHPFAAAPGERLYRTGDLARWQPDGKIDFLGRIDRQVKIRGFRVEPAEIEATLELHPAVAAAVVEPRDDGRGGKRLIGWIVPAAELLSDAELLAWCHDRLPAFMVPAACVRLDALPLDPNGKVDRKALPDPAWRGDDPVVAPRTPDEERIAAIWADVLDAAEVGIEDDFFALGGHSLLAARMISRVRAELGVDLPLRALFENPTVRALAAEAGRLAPGRRAALPPPRPRPRGAEAPLSFAQRRLWVLHQLDPRLVAYHVPAGLRLRGRLDRAALERALGEIVRRHEALRTSFPVRGGEPVQAVAPAAPVHLAGVDLAGLPAGERQAEARRIGGAMAGRPFDLERGPLLRLDLLRLDAEEHALLVVAHHLVSDGWSTAVFLRELSILYAAFLRGLPSPLPEPALQYADWALWQREWCRDEVLAEQLRWWRERLDSAPRVLDLPTDFPRPAVESQAGAAVPLRLPRALVADLRRLARAEGATLYMVLLAAFQALLARRAGEETVCAGTHVAGRDRLESEDLIGFFVNTLVIRADLDGDPSGRELIARVREAVLGAFAHQDLPFEKLVEALNPPRDPRWSPLYQAAFTLQNAPREDLRLPGLDAELLEVGTGTAQLDLSLTLTETAEGAAGALVYRTALFAGPTIRRLAGHWEALLEALAAEPGRPVPELPLLSAAERAAVTAEWSGLAVLPPAGEGTFPLLFEAQVDRTPDAPAVACAGRMLTYRELDESADRVARWLRGRGVGPETRVALRLERSPEILAALLGIWKAGGAYVPIDAATPPERLSFLRDDAAVALEVTAEDVAGLDLTGERAGRLGLPTMPEQLACVIYTSGSTGRPKGVMISHGGLMVFARALAETLPLSGGEGRRFGLNASLVFDASMQALVQLLAGACIWIVPEEARHDADHMAAFFRAADLDVLDCTPSQLELILEAMEASQRPPRLVLIGGEPIPPAQWRRMASHPRTRFWNVYGPTECTVELTGRQVCGEQPDVGRPWPGAGIWLLEPSGLPAAAGGRAEIWIGGAQVGRGYLGRPDLTADRFRPGPFSGEPGARLYRTGDLGRWLADGRIDLLGRADQQVKLRGHRIELGEIEARLLAHPLVREVAAGLREDGHGGQHLVAWIVPQGEPDPRELRRWLGEHLPAPMVPSVLLVLDRLPKTASGKLDRRALPDPAPAGGAAEPVSTPADPVERKLLELFREALGVERVDPSDSLFELGGHSLTAFRLATRIREAFGVRLAVNRLFTDPTPAGLAEVIRGMERDDAGLPPVRRVARDLPLPLSLAQQRLWVLHQLTPGLTTYQIPAGLRLRGRLDVSSLQAALTGILRRHEALRTHFPVRGGDHSPSPHMEPVQAIDPPAPAALPVLDLAAVPAGEREAEARRIAAGEAVRPFDLERGPLLRFLLLALGPEDHVFFLVVHHLVSDGWSTALFLRELAALYGAGVHGEPSPLPEPPVQYADWAVWQREQLHGEVLDAHLRWWSERLADAPRVLDLPTDRPRPPVESPAGASVPLRLAKPLVEALRQIALAQGATLYMTLLAGFQALLARLASQETVCVGTHVARRHRLEVEGLIGFFVNTVVIRADVTARLTGRALVEHVREAVFGAFAHQDLPFERLVEAFHLERDPRWSPLFQVSFALQNVPHEEPRLLGLDVEHLEIDTGAAHFDLAAAFVETAGGATGSIRYRTALFHAPTIRRLAGHYEAFLQALAAEPDRPVETLSILSAAERHQILVEWAGPERPPAAGSLPELFARQAARTPAAQAVVCGKDTMTYGDLDRRSGQLARRLRRHGAGPETVVAISVERSLEMVVGLLGILKSGAAYLPIDPLNPRERQAFLLDDGGASIVLTQERWAAGLQAPGRKVFLLERTDPAERTDRSDGREGDAEGELQALFYTSGSTGRPKATLLERRGLFNLCLWFRDVCPITPQTRSLLGFSFSFDAAFKNILVPLLSGGTTVLPPPGPFDAREMLEAIRREAVTFLNTTPSQMAPILRQAAEDGWKGLVTLRTLILGGEAPRWAELGPWLASGRCRAEILHMYGPSEVSDTVSCHRATRDEIAAAGRLPVGRAADNLRLIVIDAGLQPLPIGVPGELCLAGAGVARGYLGRPALTAEKFIPDPFHPRGRMYRTGDLARWLIDGSVEILGRIDHQVKIRGTRVEPAEVEAALIAHPAIAGAVVGVREDAAGEKRLIAWLVPVEGAGLPPPGILREHLRESLPEVMIPAAFVPLAALPVTPRGKVDRNALPDPEAGRAEAASVPPRDAVELRLAGLFQEVLGGGDIGVRDSFFELGGHSLAAVRLAGRIRETLRIELPVAALFQAPTVEALARLLRHRGEIAWSPLVPLRAAGDGEPLYLVHPGGGSVFAYLDLVRRFPPGRPVFGLQASGLDAGQEPLREVAAMAERYLAEIRRLQPPGPWQLAGWSFGGLVAFEMARRLRAEGDEVAGLALIDPTDPSDKTDPFDPDGIALLAVFVRELGLPPQAFDLTAEEARRLAPEERWSRLLEKARETGLLRPGDDLADLRRRFEVFRASAQAAAVFRPGPYDGPLDLFEAAGRPAPAATWRRFARHTVVLPGDHYTLLVPPQVEALARALSGW